ncbi:hypothetical protein Dimus_033349 [Dionaea muscipula]
MVIHQRLGLLRHRMMHISKWKQHGLSLGVDTMVFSVPIGSADLSRWRKSMLIWRLQLRGCAIDTVPGRSAVSLWWIRILKRSVLKDVACVRLRLACFIFIGSTVFFAEFGVGLVVSQSWLMVQVFLVCGCVLFS